MNVTPFLMFEGRCEEAMNFYVGLIPGSRIVEIEVITDSTLCGIGREDVVVDVDSVMS